MRRIVIILTVFVGLCGNGFAQNDTTKIILKKSMLNGHVFTSINSSNSAFISTFLNAELGLGNTGSLELPGLSIGDYDLLSFAGSVTFATTHIDYSQKINDWLALRLSTSLGGRVGSNMSTILIDGLNTFSGGSIGWDFRFVRKQKFQMTGSVFVKNIDGSFIDIAGYIKDIVNDNPFPQAIRNIPVVTAGVAAQGAYAFNKAYGLQFGADISYGESFTRNEQSFYSAMYISGDLDLMPRKNIPLGFAAGYKLSSDPEDTYLEFIYTSIYSGKIAYTGSSDFDLGLQFIANRVKLSEGVGETPIVLKTQFNFKLYF